MREPCPTLQGKPLDTFQQNEILALAISDPHEARALELEALGFHRLADRIRKCSQSSGPFPRRTCKLRCCPTCSKFLAAKHKCPSARAHVMVEAVGRLTGRPTPELRPAQA
jgi:hypothetical protein